jgi:hypothetical protein
MLMIHNNGIVFRLWEVIYTGSSRLNRTLCPAYPALSAGCMGQVYCFAMMLMFPSKSFKSYFYFFLSQIPQVDIALPEIGFLISFVSLIQIPPLPFYTWGKNLYNKILFLRQMFFTRS